MNSPRHPTERDKEIGRELARRRRAAGKPQADVGAALGLSAQQYGKYERGENRIASSRLEEIHRVFAGKSLTAGFAESQAPFATHDLAASEKGALLDLVEAVQKDLDRLRKRVEQL